MERPLYSPPVKPVISAEVRTGDERGITADPLFAQIIIDKARLKANIRRVLQGRNQVTLAEVLRECPLTQGLAEVITYFAIAGADHRQAIFDDNVSERICWLDDQDRQRCATLPRIIFNR
jgi:hypothetical protein